MKKAIKAATLGTGLILSLVSGGVVNAEWTAGMTGPGDANGNLNGTHNVGGQPVDNWFDATDNPAEAKSTGQFEIVISEDPDNPDEKDGKLTLDKVPNMNFGKTTVRKVSDGAVTLSFVDGAVTANDSAFDGNNDGKLQISDYRGTATGWRLNVALGNFENIDKEGVGISNATLKLLPVIATDNANADTPEVETAVDIEMGQNQNVINTTTATRGQGKNMYLVDANTKLDFARQNIQEGIYQADITWTLVNAPS